MFCVYVRTSVFGHNKTSYHYVNSLFFSISIHPRIFLTRSILLAVRSFNLLYVLCLLKKRIAIIERLPHGGVSGHFDHYNLSTLLFIT